MNTDLRTAIYNAKKKKKKGGLFDLSVSTLDYSTGAAAGGTLVHISGVGMSDISGIKFGGVAATNILTHDHSFLSCRTGAHAAGLVSVVFTKYGEAVTKANCFTFYVLTFDSIDPVTGDKDAQTAVALTGTGFLAGSKVYFDGVIATDIVIVNPTTITCVTPVRADIGEVDVVVTQGGDALTLTGGYTYNNPD